MAKKKKDENVETPEQGLGATTENAAPANADLHDASGNLDQGEETLLEADVPEWVEELLESNQAVVDSNNTLIEALGNFKCSGGSGEAKQNATPETPAKREKVKAKAQYVVREGKAFVNKHDRSKVYVGGEEVSDLDKERLQNLLDQGIIEEA